MEVRYSIHYNPKTGRLEVKSLLDEYREYYPSELLKLVNEHPEDVRIPTYQYFLAEYRKQLEALQHELHIRTLLDNR